MAINLNIPDISELKPRITVFGVGGAGGNAVNNMITAGLAGVDFVVANTDAQALTLSKAERIIQMGTQVTQGLGAGSQPDVGAAAAEEVIDEIRDHLSGANMVFVTAGMGGGTGTGAAPVIAKAAREMGILTVGVVTKPFHFEGQRRMRTAEAGIAELHKVVDTLLIIPNQNLFRVANEKTTFADAFAMADQVLYSGVACITDLMVKEGLINLDFADVRAVMREMGKAMMGTGEASGEKRALTAAEAAIANPLIDDSSMKGARGLLISITGGKDLTLYEVDEAAPRIREAADQDATMVQALDPVKPSTTRAPISIKRPVADGQPPARPSVEIETQVEAAVAEAISHPQPAGYVEDDGVTVEPYIPAASHEHYDEHLRVDEVPVPSVYVPSNAARPDGQRRMPRTEELPAVARRTLEATDRQEAEPRNARALFKRLASNVGRNLRPQAEPEPEEPPRLETDDAAARSAIEAGGARVSRPPSVPEGAAGQLDPHGRQITPPMQKERLEIPAFLRKHG
jgi:cell division protein FtsZ